MRFSLIEICNDCGLTLEDWVVSGTIAVVIGVVAGLLRFFASDLCLTGQRLDLVSSRDRRRG